MSDWGDQHWVLGLVLLLCIGRSGLGYGDLGLGMTANQNSIPRELVFDVDVMLADKLDTVPFPFIGTSVPEGHQGQSVEAWPWLRFGEIENRVSQERIAWSFNADHQPIEENLTIGRTHWWPVVCSLLISPSTCLRNWPKQSYRID